jgi:hypothetical protein
MPREGKPVFAICSRTDGIEFYILVVWPDGFEDRINFFASREDPSRWIEREGNNWLRMRNGTAPG